MKGFTGYAIAFLSVIALAVSCNDGERWVDFCQPVYFAGSDGDWLSLNVESYNDTDRTVFDDIVTVAADNFTLTVQPGVDDGCDMEDPEIEDNMESYIKETYTEKRKLPADGVLPPASLPLFVSYTLNTIRDISVSSDTEMFGIEPGNDLSQCFVLADPSYHPYCCMVFRGKKVGAYRTGISIDEYLRMEPMFAGMTAFRFTDAYSDMVESETVCRFTVTLVLDDGRTVEGVTARYRLTPAM